jgi:hypothetical protein
LEINYFTYVGHSFSLGCDDQYQNEGPSSAIGDNQKESTHKASSLVNQGISRIVEGDDGDLERPKTIGKEPLVVSS